MIWPPSSPIISAPIFFQDTVVALQALSKYGAATFVKGEKAATVTVKSAGAFSEEFQVDEAKRLLLQEVALPEIPGKYSTAVTGSGCVYVQVRLARVPEVSQIGDQVSRSRSEVQNRERNVYQGEI